MNKTRMAGARDGTDASLVVDEDLDVSERLSVEDEVLAMSDRVVHVKVLLTEQVLVQVQLLQISVERETATGTVSTPSRDSRQERDRGKNGLTR